MGFLKQILKPFVEFDSDNKNKTEPDKTIVEKQTDIEEAAHHPLISEDEAVNLPSNEQVAPARNNSSIPLPEHVRYFEELLDKANRENPLFTGPDYKEFIDTKVDIDDITDETIKYQTVFNILKTSGLTKNKLISTGQEYLDIVGRDLNAFQSAHAQLYKKELVSREIDLKNKVAELQTLTQTINALKAAINQLTKEINESQEELNFTKRSFLLAGEMKQQEIQSELNKISKFF
ncbi:MAG: hypothetical protein H7329_12135 [Opitutaceae bacterium]|nr:hypothetical protein [Cytophagales bacterium]